MMEAVSAPGMLHLCDAKYLTKWTVKCDVVILDGLVSVHLFITYQHSF